MKEGGEDELITLAEAARLRNVNYDAMLKLVRRGKLRAKKMYGVLLVYRQEVLAYIPKKTGRPKGTKKNP